LEVRGDFKSIKGEVSNDFRRTVRREVENIAGEVL
jgi:hypothetical protein